MDNQGTLTWRTRKGLHFEVLAAKHLRKQGLQLLTRNYRCPPGEIDLVMLDRDMLVFVEVRFRANTGHGSASETVDFRKQRKLQRAAQYFLLQHKPHAQRACRFDVVGIDLVAGQLQLNWLRNVFV
jgi:putative endonuclease